jgi:hypothetical protein
MQLHTFVVAEPTESLETSSLPMQILKRQAS